MNLRNPMSCLRATTTDWRISSSNVIPKAKDMESKSTHTRICSGVEWPEGPQSLHKSYPIVARLIHGMFQTIKDLSRYKGCNRSCILRFTALFEENRPYIAKEPKAKEAKPISSAI